MTCLEIHENRMGDENEKILLADYVFIRIIHDFV